MIDKAEKLAALLTDTPLAGRKVVTVPILDTGENAFAIKIAADEVEPAWRIARALLPDTGHWPLATTSFGNSSWRDAILDEDLFSRFYFNEAPDASDVSPQGLCRKADQADYRAAFDAIMQKRQENAPLEERLEYAIEYCRHRVGSVPQPSEIAAASAAGLLDPCYGLDRWLADWETSRGFRADPADGRQEWYVPDQTPTALLFLPVSEGWDALAYLNWFGTSDIGSEHYIALGRSWRQRFGAELVAHYGTMLQCLVSRPPQTLEEGWKLACEHDLAGECTLALPGIEIRDYAQALIGWDRWFLHERP